jgi:cytochrome b
MAVNKLDAGINLQDEAAAAAPASVPATHRVKLWDLPLRVFHWSLLVAVTTAIVTGKLGGEWMSLHGKAGIAIVGLLAFRVVWGLVGSGTSRFAHFLPTPGALLAYVKGRWRGIGHNPLGALSVVALIGLIGFQAISGLFSNDDIAFAGPLAGLVDEELSQWFTGWHHQVVNGLFVLLGLHVVAIFFHVKVKKDDIVTPMVTGWKKVPIAQAVPRQGRLGALILAVSAGLGAGYAASGAWITPDAPPAPSAASPATAPATAAPAW